jgi:hypothetical protein
MLIADLANVPIPDTLSPFFAGASTGVKIS